MHYRDMFILTAIVVGLSIQPAMAQSEPQDQEQPGITEIPEDSESEVFRARPAEDGKKYIWQDGEYTISLWEAENLVMERTDADEQSEQSSAIAPEDVIAVNDNLRVVKKQSWHQLGDDVFPVLVTANGEWKALPGGVLVVLDPEMRQANIDAFFAKMELTQVSKMDFTKNAYLIETEPGIIVLELSNKLAGMEEVKLSSPNWWSPAELR